MESWLPSAKISGRQSPTTVLDFAEPGCGAVDHGVVLEQQPGMFDFLQHSDLDQLTIASVQWEYDSDETIDCDLLVASDDDPLPPPVLLPTGTGFYDSTTYDDEFFDTTTCSSNSPIAALYGYTEVHCLYIPTLEAVILSPDYPGKFLRCRGYVSISNFDGQGCGITLCHCRHSPQDIHFLLMQVCGLVFTGPLLLPSADPSLVLQKPHVERI